MQAGSGAGGNASAVHTGIQKLGLSQSGRDGYVFVPSGYNAAAGLDMILAIHAAGKGGLDALGLLIDQANSSGVQQCHSTPAALKQSQAGMVFAAHNPNLAASKPRRVAYLYLLHFSMLHKHFTLQSGLPSTS